MDLCLTLCINSDDSHNFDHRENLFEMIGIIGQTFGKTNSIFTIIFRFIPTNTHAVQEKQATEQTSDSNCTLLSLYRIAFSRMMSPLLFS